ncbi:MAG TPA: hypothetical protein VF145_02725, partial [Chitinophagaceae bacterium]
MRNLNLLLATVMLGIVSSACQKEQVRTTDRLMSFSDANRKYSLVYNGSHVTEMKVDSGAGAPFTIVNYSYSTNYIRATLHPSTGYDYVEYYMRKSVLPVSILKHKKINGIDSVVSRTDFYYPENKDIVDSVVLRTYVKLTFIPVYSGGNVTDYYLRQGNQGAILSGSFLYYPVVNLFKTTNPLLFVYSSPVFEFETFLMPRLFSQLT